MLFRNYLKIISLFCYTLILQLGSYHWTYTYSIGKHSKYSMSFDKNAFESEKFIKGQNPDFESWKYLHEKSQQGAESLFNGFQFQTANSTSKNEDKSLLCITIVAKSRPYNIKNYVTRSLAYLLSRLEPLKKLENQPRLKVYLTNTDQPEWINSTLSTFGPIVEIVHTKHIEKEMGLDNFSQRNNNDRSIYRNETLGKALTFYYALKFECSHLVILEDDGIVSKDFYWKIQDAITELRNTKYFAIKLFNSDRFGGWSMDPGNLLFFIWSTGVTAAISITPTFIFVLCSRYALKRWTFLLTGFYLWFWIFYCWLFLTIGKQPLLPFFNKPGVIKCSRHMGPTIGVIYPGEHLKGIFNYLLEKVELMIMDSIGNNKREVHNLLAYDTLLDDYAEKTLNLDTYLLVPNVVQRIGRYSTFNNKTQGKFHPISYTFPKEDEVFR